MADPGIFDWGAEQTLVLKGLLNCFVAYYLSQSQPQVSQTVKADRRWRGKYCFARRGKQIIGRVPKNNYSFEYPWNLV